MLGAKVLGCGEMGVWGSAGMRKTAGKAAAFTRLEKEGRENQARKERGGQS